MRRLMIFSLLILALGAGGAAAQEILNENYWLSAPVAISHTRLDSAAAYVYPGLSYPTGTVGVLLVGSVSGTGTTGGLNRPIFRLKVGGASTWELVYDIGSRSINHYWASGAASTALASEGYTGVAGFSAGSDVLTFSSVSWGHGVTYTADLNLYYLIDASVNPPPFDASFEATPASGPAPLTVSFTDTSTGDITNWDWNFGDGTGSSGSSRQDPVHVYSEKGIYIVTLTISNDEQTDTYSMNINVGTNEDPPSACLNLDKEFRNPARWLTVGQVEFTYAGVILYPASRLTAAADLFLDNASSYNVTALTQSLTSYAGAYRLNLGEEVFNLTALPSSGPGLTQVAADNPQPDKGLFYSLGIVNTGTAPILFTSLCVDDGTRSLTPGRCLFNNPTFDGLPATTAWQTSGDVSSSEALGRIIMGDDAAISQRIKMYPNDPQNPHQYLFYALVAVSPAYKNDAVNTIALEYEFPQSAGFEPVLSPAGAEEPVLSTLFTQNAYNYSFLPGGFVRFVAYIEVSDVTDDLFTFRVNTSDEDVKVYVDEICIDDTFAHHDDYPWLPIWDLDPQCAYIAIPTANDVGSWTYWHWQNLDKFFRCDLMKMLNRMFNTMWSGYRLLQWQTVYWQALMIEVNQWFSSDLFPWLNGHFRNMAVGQVTTIEGGSGAGLWDVLLAVINLIRPVLELITSTLGVTVTLLLSVITGVIAFVVSLAGQALGILQQAIGLLGTLISAYNNAPPETLPGMPSCTANPQGHPLCIAWWVLDNTIFSGPGALVIPVLTGVLSIHLVLWVVGELKRSLVETGSSS